MYFEEIAMARNTRVTIRQFGISIHGCLPVTTSCSPCFCLADIYNNSISSYDIDSYVAARDSDPFRIVWQFSPPSSCLSRRFQRKRIPSGPFHSLTDLFAWRNTFAEINATHCIRFLSGNSRNIVHIFDSRFILMLHFGRSIVTTSKIEELSKRWLIISFVFLFSRGHKVRGQRRAKTYRRA